MKWETRASERRGYLAGVQMWADGRQRGINRRRLITAKITSLSVLRIAPCRGGYDSTPAQLSLSHQHRAHTRSSDFSPKLEAVGTCVLPWTAFTLRQHTHCVLGALCM